MMQKAGIGIITLAGVSPLFGVGLLYVALGAVVGLILTLRGD